MTKDTMIALARWYQTKRGFLMFGAVELAIAYVFASLAIDRGSWWWYALTLLFFIGALQNFVKLVGRIADVKARRTR